MHKILESSTKFSGVVFNAKVEKVVLPNGHETFRELVDHKGGASIVAVDKNGDIILVKQYRHAANSEVLEIPAGVIEPKEDHAITAARELQEETGYTAKKITHLTSMYAAVGYCNEILHIYLGEDLTEGEQNLDEGEFVTVHRYPLETVIDMIFSGEIKDAKTIAGVLAYKELLKRR